MTSAQWEVRLDDGRVEALLSSAGDEAAYLIGEHVLDVSNRHVPHEDGPLEQSGRVTDPEMGEVTVYYDTPYAVRQHEELTWEHDAGRTAKYLENAMHSERRAAQEIAARVMKL